MENILLLATSLTRQQAGAAHAAISFANEIAQSTTVELTVVAHDIEDGLLHERIKVIKYQRPPKTRFLWRFPFLRRVDKAAEELRKLSLERPDVCYTATNDLGLAVRQLFPDVPVVAHPGAIVLEREYIEETSQQSRFLRWVNSRMARNLEAKSYQQDRSCHLVSTPLVAQQRAKHFGIPEELFTVAPLGIDVQRFSPTDDVENMRERFGIPAEAVVLVSVARLVDWKRIDLTIESFCRLRDENVYLFIVGKGEAKERLEALAAASGAGDNIRFVGHADPVPFLAASDVFVLPSRIESFGVVYAEAMCMGLPCIGSRNNPPEVISSASDVIPEGQCGYCVSSVDELVNRLSQLVADAELRKSLGAKARQHVLDNYSNHSYLTQFCDAVNSQFGLSIQIHQHSNDRD